MSLWETHVRSDSYDTGGQDEGGQVPGMAGQEGGMTVMTTNTDRFLFP